MAIALVSAGSPNSATSTTATASFGQSTTAGNLLVAWVACPGSNIQTATGWQYVSGTAPPILNTVTGVASLASNIFILFKQNCGAGETAPSFTLGTNVTWFMLLAEFSGVATTGIAVDQFLSTSGNFGSGTVEALPTPDIAASGSLLCTAYFETLSSAAADSPITDSYNNGAAVNNLANNDSGVVTNHYHFSYGITTGNSSADSNTITFGATVSTNGMALVSFRPAGSGARSRLYAVNSNDPGVVTTAATSSVTPTFTSATVAGNLAVALVVVKSGATAAVTTSTTGWVAINAGTSNSVQTQIFYKPNIAASEANPTFTATSATSMAAVLLEFAGADLVSPLDQSTTQNGPNSGTSVSTNGVDTTLGEAIVSCWMITNSKSATATISNAYSGGAVVGKRSLNDGGTKQTLFYSMVMGASTSSNASADTDSLTFTPSTGALSSAAKIIASFLGVFDPIIGPQLNLTRRPFGFVYDKVKVLQYQATARYSIIPGVGAAGNQFTRTLTATLTFTGPTNLTNAITKLISGTLTFTGPTNLKNAITKGLASAALSFTGALTKAITKILPGATLTFTGAFVKQLQKKLSGVLSFTGPVNLVKNITKLISGGLSFTGSQTKAITKGLAAATLSFTGAITKAVTKGLAAATLTFTGAIAIVRQFNRALTATLTFTGPTNLTKAITKGVSGTLTFTGAALVKAITKGISGTLTFTGAIVKAVTKGLAAAALTFTGVLTTIRQFNRSLTATLTFTGAFIKQTNKSMTATLSFTGAALVKNITKLLSGGLSFTGSFVKAISKGLASASLSFTGAFVKQLQKSLTATLSFTGAALVKSIAKGLTATLSFTGASLVKAITKGLTGTLSFTGNLVKSTSKFMTATLTFTGAITKSVSKFMTAALSFVGNLVNVLNPGGNHFFQTLTGALSFTGPTNLVKVTSKNISGGLSFTGPVNLVKSIGKGITATLSFSGSILKAITKNLPAAVLSFTGSIVLNRIFARAFTAALSFTGAINRNTSKGISGILSFLGILPTPPTPAPTTAFPGTQLMTEPPMLDIAVTETFPLKVDVSNYLRSTDTIGSYLMSLVQIPTGQPVPWPWRLVPTTVVGNVMTITLIGSALQLGQQYQLRVTIVLNDSTKILTFLTYINVVA